MSVSMSFPCKTLQPPTLRWILISSDKNLQKDLYSSAKCPQNSGVKVNAWTEFFFFCCSYTFSLCFSSGFLLSFSALRTREPTNKRWQTYSFNVTSISSLCVCCSCKTSGSVNLPVWEKSMRDVEGKIILSAHFIYFSSFSFTPFVLLDGSIYPFSHFTFIWSDIKVDYETLQ